MANDEHVALLKKAPPRTRPGGLGLALESEMATGVVGLVPRREGGAGGAAGAMSASIVAAHWRKGPPIEGGLEVSVFRALIKVAEPMDGHRSLLLSLPSGEKRRQTAISGRRLIKVTWMTITDVRTFARLVASAV